MPSRSLPQSYGCATWILLGCTVVAVCIVLVVAFHRRQTSQTRQDETSTPPTATERTRIVRRATPRLQVEGGRPYNYVDRVRDLRVVHEASDKQLGIDGTIVYETGVVRTSTPPPWL